MGKNSMNNHKVVKDTLKCMRRGKVLAYFEIVAVNLLMVAAKVIT